MVERVGESFDCLGLNDGNDRVKCLWVRTEERSKQIWWDSAIDHPARVRRSVKSSVELVGEISPLLALVPFKLQLTRCLLEIQHSREETVQGVPGVCWR